MVNVIDELSIPMTKKQAVVGLLKADSIIQRFTSSTPKGTEKVQDHKYKVIVREHTDSTATN